MRFDVVVVGGGPAGSVCTAQLADLGLGVALITGQRRRSSWLELLAPEGVLALRGLGFQPPDDGSIWRACPGIIDTWGADAPAVSDFDLMRCSPGWIVDRAAFDCLLLDFACTRGVRLIEADAPVRATDVASAPVVLEWASYRVEADFLVDAGGVAGRVVPGRYARRRWFDRLVAVRALTPTRLSKGDWMHLGSSSAGWWYVLPCADGQAQSVFLTDGDLLPRPDDRPRHLMTQFAEAFGSRLEVQAECPFEIRDARTSCRRILWAQHWMPVGDAAFAIDPLSGGGLTRALRMAEEVTSAVAGFVATRTFEGLRIAAVRRAVGVAKLLESLQSRYQSNDKPRHAVGSEFWFRRRSAVHRSVASPPLSMCGPINSTLRNTAGIATEASSTGC